MKRFLISNKRIRTSSPKSVPRVNTDNIPDQPLNKHNFVESDGTTISESDGPTTRPPHLEEPVTAPVVTDVEKDTVMEWGSNSTSESEGASTATASSTPNPAPGKLMPRARELTPADADSTPSTACGPHDLSGNVLSGVSALNPKHKSFLDQLYLLTMAQNYGITEDNLNAELNQVRHLLGRKSQQGHSVNTTLELLTLMAPYKEAFMNLYNLLCISLTLQVTSTCERSFSCLRHLTLSKDARSSNLGLLAINIKRAQALNIDKIINAFALSHNNRRIVL